MYLCGGAEGEYGLAGILLTLQSVQIVDFEWRGFKIDAEKRSLPLSPVSRPFLAATRQMPDHAEYVVQRERKKPKHESFKVAVKT